MHSYSKILQRYFKHFKWGVDAAIKIELTFIVLNLAPSPGLIADLYGDYAPTFYVAGSFTLVGFASMFLTYRLKPAGPQIRDLDEERASATSELLVVVDKVSVL